MHQSPAPTQAAADMPAPLRIAYLAPYSPWPTNFGGALRIEALWRALGELGEVALAVVGDRPGRDVRRRLRASGATVFPSRLESPRARQVRLIRALLRDRCIPAARYLSPRRLDRIAAWLATARPDVIVLGDEYLASLLPLRAGGARVVVDTHNAASRGHWRMARASGALLTRLQYACLAVNTARMERRCFPLADQVWAVSDEDAAFYAPRGQRVHVVPNVVDVPADPASAGDAKVVVLTGSFAYPPSEDAALRLVALTAPFLREGSLRRVLIVGRASTARMRAAAAAHPGIEIIGAVPEVGPWLRQGALFVAPIAAGSGTKLKILEALACGRAVLTTPLGAEGLALEPGLHAEVVELEQLAPALRSLLANEGRCAAMGRAGHAHVLARFSRQAMRSAVARALAELGLPPR